VYFGVSSFILQLLVTEIEPSENRHFLLILFGFLPNKISKIVKKCLFSEGFISVTNDCKKKLLTPKYTS